MGRPWERPIEPSGYPSAPSQSDLQRARIAGAYIPSVSLLPFEAFRLGAGEGRAETWLSESRALHAEGRAVAAALMDGRAA